MAEHTFDAHLAGWIVGTLFSEIVGNDTTLRAKLKSRLDAMKPKNNVDMGKFVDAIASKIDEAP